MNWKQLSSGLIAVLLAVATAGLLVSHFHIPDFAVIKPRVLYTSGQPRGMDYTRLLYKYHIATIVNVRIVSEHRNNNWYNEEVTWIRENGVPYVALPIEKANYFPNEVVQKQFLDLMNDSKNLPVLLHGSRSDKRVAMLTVVWLRKALGYNAAEAIREVQKIIDNRQLTQADIQFINNLTK